MGILQTLAKWIVEGKSGTASGTVDGVRVDIASFVHDTNDLRTASEAALWKAQPHLRTVVDFMARQVAQLGLHVYVREGDVSKRQRDGALVEALSRPNGEDTLSELIYALVGGIALYDDVLVLVLPNLDGGSDLRVIPTVLAPPVQRTPFSVKRYELALTDMTKSLTPDQVVRFKGWSPDDVTMGTSPVRTLKQILWEQAQSWEYRRQQWQKSGRYGGFFTRPKDAPRWDGDARKRFLEMINAFTSPQGSRAGEDTILEDGIEFKRAGFAAREDQWLESVKLSLETCAQVYGINPTMIGVLDNANYANVREFRRALYGDSLGWMIKRIEDRFNTFLLPLLGAQPGEYVEFNVEAKLRGSFEEQAEVLSKSVGAPWLTRNEARAMFNRPALADGEELVTPLNVLVGGQASPMDGKARGVLEKFATRQREAVLAKKATGTSDWWDGERWDRELCADLFKSGIGLDHSTEIAREWNARALAALASGEPGPNHDALEVLR